MSKILDLIFVRDKHVCPWWLCFTFDNIFRKLIHNPYKILSHYIKEGDTVLDVGPGMGYFTIPMAKMVGDKGRVIAADIQERMLLALKKRAQQAGVEKSVIGHLSSKDSLGIKEQVNFIMAFWMVHEVPDHDRLFEELKAILKPDGRLYIIEPKLHVSKVAFEKMIAGLDKSGFEIVERPKVFFSRAVLLKRS